MRLKLTLGALIVALLLPSVASAQFRAVSVRAGATDPATCQPSGTNIFLNTTSDTLKICSATNTWTAAGGSAAGTLFADGTGWPVTASVGFTGNLTTFKAASFADTATDPALTLSLDFNTRYGTGILCTDSTTALCLQTNTSGAGGTAIQSNVTGLGGIGIDAYANAAGGAKAIWARSSSSASYSLYSSGGMNFFSGPTPAATIKDESALSDIESFKFTDASNNTLFTGTNRGRFTITENPSASGANSKVLNVIGTTLGGSSLYAESDGDVGVGKDLAVTGTVSAAGGTITGQLNVNAPLQMAQKLGSEVATQTCAGWGLSSPVGAWSCSGDTITRTASGANLTITNSAAVVGTTYKVVTVTATVTAGSVTASMGGSSGAAISTATTTTEYLTATATTALTLTASATFAGTITISTTSAKAITSTISSDVGPLVVTSPGSLRFFPASGFGTLFTDGSATSPAIGWVSDADGTGTGWYRAAANAFGYAYNGTWGATFTANNAVGLKMSSDYCLSWASSNTDSSGADTILCRDGAGVLGLRNGATAQELRVYNTYTSSTNYEAARIVWSGNELSFVADKGSGGGSARGVYFGNNGDADVLMRVNNSQRWRFKASANSYALWPETTNSYDLGGTSNTVRTGYFGTSLISPLYDRPEPAATTGASQAGLPISITASDAVASTDTAGAAAGGSVTITAGDAKRNTSGNANGGDVILIGGAGIGTGTTGQTVIPDGTAAAPGLALFTNRGTGLLRSGSNVLGFSSGGSEVMRILSSFGVYPAADNVYDNGQTTTPLRWRYLVAGTGAIAPLFSPSTSSATTFEVGSQIANQGNIKLWSDGQIDFRENATKGASMDGASNQFQFPQQEKRVAANATNSTTTPSSVADLGITITNGQKYACEVVLYAADSVAAEGLLIDFDGGGATVSSFRAHGMLFDTALLLSSQTTALATDFSAATATGDVIFNAKVSFVASSTGTFIPRFAQNSHATGTATVYANSYMTCANIP